MSAICPLKVQKPAKKRNNQFLVSCRKTALLCDFWNVSKLCKMRGGIFDFGKPQAQHETKEHKSKPRGVTFTCAALQQQQTLFSQKEIYNIDLPDTLIV